MKKFLLILILFVMGLSKGFATDYLPAYVNPYLFGGNSLITTFKPFDIYSSPDEKSQIVAHIDREDISYGKKKLPLQDTYIAYVKERNIALIPVKEETDEWYQICYNQKSKLFGWVKKSNDIDIISWQELFNVYGRKLGVFVFRNVKDKHKKLYSAPDGNGNIADEFYYPRHVSLWLIGGDWILVKVTTFDGKTKTGWLRWRLEDGTILAFPDFGYVGF